MNFTRLTIPACVGISLLLSACSSLPSPSSLWPFGGDKVQDRSRAPADATEYVCGNGKRIYVRSLDSGNAAWLILPDREMRLDKSGNSTRYVSGSNTLEINGAEASFKDGSNNAYASCKAKTAN